MLGEGLSGTFQTAMYQTLLPHLHAHLGWEGIGRGWHQIVHAFLQLSDLGKLSHLQNIDPLASKALRTGSSGVSPGHEQAMEYLLLIKSHHIAT